jgi:hypothetical protein
MNAGPEKLLSGDTRQKENLMILTLKKFFLLATILLLGFDLVNAQDKVNGNPPPSSQLQYRLRADIKGLSVEGQGQIDWHFDARQYRLVFDTSTQLTGQLMSEKSEGAVDRHGLVPANFLLKRMRKEPVAVVFDRRAGLINFAGDTPAHKIQGGEQDRLSVLWQLLSMARARPGSFTPGSTWKFFVAGHRGGESWTFQVKDKQRLRTSLGEIDTLHVVHLPTDPGGGRQVDIWLAPSQEWFPVRLRFTEPGGGAIEQTIEKIIKK